MIWFIRIIRFIKNLAPHNIGWTIVNKIDTKKRKIKDAVKKAELEGRIWLIPNNT